MVQVAEARDAAWLHIFSVPHDCDTLRSQLRDTLPKTYYWPALAPLSSACGPCPSVPSLEPRILELRGVPHGGSHSHQV